MRREERLYNNRGQAVLELAILSSILIVVLAAFFNYAQRLDAQQAVKMEAFREALFKAYNRNSAVSYTLKKDSRQFNLMGGFGQGQPSSTGATVSVMWQKGVAGQQGKTDEQSFAYYKINNDMLNDEKDGLRRYQKKSKGYDGSESLVTVPVSVWNEERQQYEQYATTVTKREDNPPGTRGRIVNTSSYNLDSSIVTTAKARFDTSYGNPNDEPPMPSYDPGKQHTYTVSQGAGFNEDNRIEYRSGQSGSVGGTRSWTTEFPKQ